MERITQPLPGFRPVPMTGVIYVMTEAGRRGYSASDPSWVNLGQGAPETGALPDSPKRQTEVQITENDHEYAPIDGIMELRKAVAELYNQRYRQGKKSQYSWENVAISSGGRVGLTRAVSTLGKTNVGHFLPDYTAYEELLDSFGSFVPIPIMVDPDQDYEFSAEALEREILGRGLSAVLLSNPNNPTGKLIHGDSLKQWVRTATSLGCTLILDEFYSHYIYDTPALSVSAAEYVEDVDKDPIIIVDGLTKNWRYPGWRVSWTVAPKGVIESIASAGSFLDGGCARPMQLAALQVVKREIADAEAKAIQTSFKTKREFLTSAISDLGLKVSPRPQGAFYCWTDLSSLPAKLQSGMDFFRSALEQKVIVVPGEFFDINPGRRRHGRPSRFANHVRISFGPSMEMLEKGVEGLRKVVR